tara:strand:+ start:72633 stop:72845 length:213 start_codon:yes stop_codon:yes gene_type:complete
MQTALSIHSHTLVHVIAAPFQAIADFVDSLSRATAAADYMEDYSTLSDADLAAQGMTRDDVKRNVLQILG